MAHLRVMQLLLLLITIITAARFPQRRSAPIASTPKYDSDDYEALEVEDYESEYSTTEFPYYDYTTTSSSEEEYTTEEETFARSFGEAVTAPDLADGHLTSANEVDPLNESLSELFYESHPVKKLDFELCEARLREGDLVQHYTYLEHNVYVSSLDSHNRDVGRVKPKPFTWEQAHDLCRSHCKELITMDSYDKFYLLNSIIKSDGLLGIWTSGRRCDFPGCRDRKDVREDGWFWTTSGQEVYTRSQQSYHSSLHWYDWAMTGRAGPQPDNAEFADRGVNESCLALRYDISTKGLQLHDLPCHNKLNVVCEEPLEINELRDYL